MSRKNGRWRAARIAAALLLGAGVALGLGASEGRAAQGDQITITLLANTIQHGAFDVLISNFERAYPNITVDPTYDGIGTQYQLTTTELGAGSGPDLITSWPGCGTAISVCVLARDGDLAPIVGAPWVRHSDKLVISLSKFGPGLYVYSPSVSFWGVFTNDPLFKKLGLAVPQTFSQLLTLCRKAQADGTIALELSAGSGSGQLSEMITDIALTTVYAHNARWNAALRAGTATFDGTAGWHEALQRVEEMNAAGCFEPAPTASATGGIAQFDLGQALMVTGLSSNKGTIDAGQPAFAYSQHPFPAGTTASDNIVMINLGSGPAVNAHSSTQNQAAAQDFIDFIARPKQDALEAQIAGGMSQYQFEKRQIPPYMSSFAPFVAAGRYRLNPGQQLTFTTDVGTTLMNDAPGLFTGQLSVDQILQAMDVAWKQGPS